MLRLAFDFIITWRETRTRPNAYRVQLILEPSPTQQFRVIMFQCLRSQRSPFWILDALDH